MDLNIEHGEIESPLKPTIRFGLPMFDTRGNRQGMFIINCLAERIFTHIKSLAQGNQTSSIAMLVNQEGYFLRGPQAEDEWGFQIPARQQRSMSTLFPEAWAVMQKKESGLIQTTRGVFTFKPIYPYQASRQAFPDLQLPGQNKPLVLYTLTFLSSQQVSERLEDLTEHLWPMLAAILALTAFFLWHLAGMNIEKQRVEEKIHQLAFFDTLTGAASRSLLEDRTKQLITHAQRNQKNFAILFIDLDNFKHINDTLGHQAGDEALIEVANRLRSCIRQSDTLARHGGDEFIVILEDIKNPEQASMVAEKMLHEVAAPYFLNKQTHLMGCSIGIAIYPQDGEDPASLTRHADLAMYWAKQHGKNNFFFYDKTLINTQAPDPDLSASV